LKEKGNEIAMKSWWPPYIILDNEYASEAYGEWNEWAEAVYSTRLSEIHSGNAQPRSISHWRGSLKAAGNKIVVRRVLGLQTCTSNY
jgi:hypothetical protein